MNHFVKKSFYGCSVGGALASHAGKRGPIPGSNRHKSLKQVVTAPLPNPRQEVCVSWVFRDYHIN